MRMVAMACTHISALEEKNKKELLISYELLHAYYVSCLATDALMRKARECLCCVKSCTKKYQRVHACLSCVYYGCFNERHIHHHAESSNHILAMDTNYGHVFCYLCKDYQYYPEFEKISQKLNLKAAYRRGSALNYKWIPLSEDLNALKGQEIINLSNIGLRGIVNLGNTCYMTVIIQSLIHAPVFRDYFLSAKHKCEKESIVNESTRVASCFACEMVDIVQEFFSGKMEAFVPNQLLYLLWQHEAELKGADQQDAHQCFLALINNLHLNCRGSSDTDESTCTCIIDTIFTGILMYTNSCTQCNNTFNKTESFKDISLDLKMQAPLSKDNGSSNDKEEGIPLDFCLRRNMQSQIHDYKCSKCLENVVCNTQMTLKQLPIIISFHLKHSYDTKKKKNSEEKNKKISFPEFLDMTPFLQSSKTQNSDNYSDNKCNSDNNSDNSDKLHNGLNGKQLSNKFYLFAVVEYSGTGRKGHYRCYVRRHKKNWFFCDDANVEPIKLQDVLKKDAYLLFYHKMFLEYDLKGPDDLTTEEKVQRI